MVLAPQMASPNTTFRPPSTGTKTESCGFMGTLDMAPGEVSWLFCL